MAGRRLVRAGWFAGGWAAVAVGGVGVVVPGLPTTVFFVVAAACFSRSSPRFEQWVLDLPRVGPLVRDHRDGLGMSRHAKRVAVTMMWIAITLSAFVLRSQPIVVGLLVAAGVVGTWYIARRVPTRETVLAARAAAATTTVTASPTDRSDADGGAERLAE
jgi:uncharacterized membrane protein YbaN (DUF454 family)